MDTLINIAITLAILIGLMIIIALSPVIAVLLSIFGSLIVILLLGYVIYAYVHDTRTAQKDIYAEECSRSRHTDDSTGSE